MTKLVILSIVFMIGLSLMFKSNKAVQLPVRDKFREEFHQTYPLATGGQVSIKNIVGTVRIAAWDRDEVRIDAVKSAETQQILNDAEIKIEAGPDEISITTKYPEDTNNLPATVEYKLTVPRHIDGLVAHMDTAPLYIDGIIGDITASTINGELMVHGIAGAAKLSTNNGRLVATFNQLSKNKPVSLQTVNGAIEVTLPADASAEIWANSMHGPIQNDFGLSVRRGEFSGSMLSGVIGGGSPRISLSNDYGGIHIRRAVADGRQ